MVSREQRKKGSCLSVSMQPKKGPKDGNLHARVDGYEVEMIYLENVVAGVGAVICWRRAWDFDAVHRG